MSEATEQTGDPTGDEVESSRMSLGDHLDELRRRLFRSAIAVVVFFVVAWSFNDQLKEFTEGPWTHARTMLNDQRVEEAEATLLAEPGRPRTDFFLTNDPSDKRLINAIDQPLYGRGVGTAFMLRLKICFFAAMAVGGPYLLWEMWGFIAAGLYKHERRTVLAYFPTSIFLFYGGIAFAYYLMLPYGIYFLNRMDPDMLRLGVEASDYLTFFTRMSVGQGIVFQLPVVMTALARVDLVTPAAMAKFRGHFVVLAFILGAIFTPGDPYTQFGMAVPMVLLYEVGIWTSRLAARKVQARSQELLAS
jgi:sec-independent protein translocase protein TatC